MNSQKTEHRFLVFGVNGWIGGMLVDVLKKQGKTVEGVSTRIENREAVMADIDRFKPTRVISCAGKTGRPNVDWCEDHKEETIRANVIGALNLADCCFLKNLHFTNFATGCIYSYDEEHQPRGKPYKEEDPANFFGSFYSSTKAALESLLRNYSNLLNLRLRMPVSDDLCSRNFVTKIVSYEYVIDIPNSNTILHDLLPAGIAMIEEGLSGVYNFTNPGAISHNEVLELYKKYVDPTYTWKNFSEEEQAKVIKAGRSNCELDTTKLTTTLEKLGVHIPEIHEAYVQCFQRMVKGEGLRSVN